jgi:antirestriction protein ArdC
MNSNGSTKDVYQMVTDKMIKAIESALENGTGAPWRKPWTTQTGGMPRSLSTQKVYRGINTFLLTLTAMEEGYSSPWWGTYNKIAELSGMVKNPKTHRWESPDGKPRGVQSGQHGTRVVWWKTVTRPDPEDDTKTISFMIGKTDVVFNACQAKGLPECYLPKMDTAPEFTELPEPESILREYIATRGPELVHAPQGRAYYQPEPDMITLPERTQFDSPEEYYSTAFHECAHSTGHKKRLGRPGILEWTGFGSHGYGSEELVAEFGASFLCASCGIESTFDNSEAYLRSWLKAIKEDIKLVSKSASAGQAAADYILGHTEESEDTSESFRQLATV